MDWLSDGGLTVWQCVAVLAAFFAGGFIKGLTGFGLPLLTVSVLSNLLPVSLVLGINVLPPLVLNMFQVGSKQRLLEAFHRFRPVLIGLVVATVLGAFITVSIPTDALVAVIGVITVTFTVINLLGWKPRPNPKADTWVGAAAGAGAGLAGVLTTVNGPPLVMYFVYAGTEQKLFKAALGLCFLCASTMLLIAFSAVGFLTPFTATLGAVAVLPAGAGMWLGAKLSDRLNAKVFQTGVLIVLLVLGLNLIRRALI